MITFLDLLVIVFMALTAVSLLSMCLMFLVRRPRIQKICFYLVAALGIIACYISCQISFGFFPSQFWFGILFGALSIAALVLERISKGDEKKFKIARIMAAAALVAGIMNAFFF